MISEEASMENLASGQRMIIYAILLNLVSAVLRVTLGDIWFLGGLLAAVLAIIGLVRVAEGLHYSTPVKILLIVLVFLPLVNLVMLVIVNARATEALRKHGYQVGLLGARRRDPSP